MENKFKNEKEIKNPKNPITPKMIIQTVLDLFGTFIGIIGWLLKTMIGIFVFCTIIAAIVGGIIFIKIKPQLDECREVAYDTLANMSEDDFVMGMDTYIYDKDGNEIGLINAGNFEYIPIENISMYIQNGYIAQEDKRFKEHMGVDLISTARAALALVKNRGEITQGGSTITQQVIKNTYLTQEQTFTRKLIEFMLAPQLEMKFSKAKIMEFYCNTNFYGNRCYGVEAASNYYFGKSAKNVTIAEAAVLVGLSNNPSAYDPVDHYEASMEKRNEVIENMYENGFITEDEKNQALNETITIVQQEDEQTHETYQSTYAIHCAAIELMKQDGFEFKYTFANKEEYDTYIEKYDELYSEKTDELRSGGYSIYTSLDSTIQEKLQRNLDTVLAGSTELQENGKYALQGAAAIADNETGYIVAVVGGRGTDDQYNRAYLSARQPGSAIKPLIDYTPAFDTGEFYPSKIMNDHEIENGPKNSGGGYRGNMTIREAVGRSVNTIAWQVLQQIGVNNGLNYLGEMQFQKISPVDNDVAALSIGGFTNGLRVVDMVKGYQTLANYGEYTSQTCIMDIKNSSGESVYSNKPEKKQVYEKDSAYMMTDVLKGVINQPYGTGRGMALSSGMPAAGKTGTTNDNKDTWFAGYTKYYTTVVWVGYDMPREMPGVFGSTYAGVIWKQVMDELHAGLELKDWDRPETIYDSFYDSATGAATSAGTGLSDIFSRTAQIRAEEQRKAEEEEAFYQSIVAEVEAYEQKNISGPEDTYSIDSDFNEINNVISQINDTDKRNELYDRIYQKYKSLIEIKDSMKEEIELYEKQKVEEESKAAAEAEQKAEEERLAFIQSTREKEAETAIENLEALEYYPETNELIDEAELAMDNIKEYDSYYTYFDRLTVAIERLDTLPSKEEYERMQAEEQARQESIAESEAAEKESMQEDLDITIIEPNTTGPSAPSTENYGPGYENPNVTITGPGVNRRSYGQ